MNEYLIKHYDKGDPSDPSLHVVYRFENLVPWLEKSKEKGIKITVYDITNCCVLDWS